MDSLLGVILMLVLVIAVVTDLRSSRIPNWLTFPAMGFALAGHAWLNGIDAVWFSLAGFGTGLGLFFLIYLAHALHVWCSGWLLSASVLLACGRGRPELCCHCRR